MKKINLNLDKNIGDVLSPEELKNISSAEWGSGSGSGSPSGYPPGSGPDPSLQRTCECIFITSKGQEVESTRYVYNDNRDCAAICQKACADTREAGGDCKESKLKGS